MHYARNPLWLKALMLAGLVGCSSDEPAGRSAVAAGDTPPVAAESATTENASVLSNPDTAAWTAGLTAKPGAGIATLSAVRTAVHDGFERIVFEFSDEMAGYHVEYIDKPVRQCGSGDVVELPGDGWLSIRFEPANAHTEEGRPTVTDRNRTLNYGNLKVLRMICDFEGQVEWVAAVASPNRYRTLELRNPARLVVDIRK